MVVILAKRLSSVGKEKVESKNFCLYYRQILQKFKPILILFFPFSLSPATVHKSRCERRSPQPPPRRHRPHPHRTKTQPPRLHRLEDALNY